MTGVQTCALPIYLKRILQCSLTFYEDFYTILTEVETVVNCRPLTYVGDDLLEDEPLTPSHLLVGHNLNSLPIPEELLDLDEDYNDASKLSRRYKRLQSSILLFQQRWKEDYLTNLRQAFTNSNNPRLLLGDVVLVENDGPRLTWKLGIVHTLHTSPDGFVRSVTLRTKSGLITRAVIHLTPLEILSNRSE